ncbi:hypothetical protein D3C87_1828370 [compost metagenome]
MTRLRPRYSILCRPCAAPFASLWVQTVQRTRERNRFPHMVQTANPGYCPFKSKTEAGVRHRTIWAQIHVPLVGIH